MESGGGSDPGDGGSVSDMTSHDCAPSHSDCSNSSLPTSADPALVSTVLT